MLPLNDLLVKKAMLQIMSLLQTVYTTPVDPLGPGFFFLAYLCNTGTNRM